jgi:hypothetical protein
MIDTTTLEAIKKRQQLTEEYASYSQSRGGLSKVGGGIAGIIVILTGTLLGGGALTFIVTLVGTLLWLVGKEWIRAHLYRPFGEAQEEWLPQKRREQRYLVLFVVGVSALIFAVYILNGAITNPRSWSYLFFVALLGPATWRFFRTPAEASVGIFLIAACAVHSVGGAYSLLYHPHMGNIVLDVGAMVVTWVPFFYAGVLIVQGITEHRRFQTLAAELGA